MVLPKFLYVVYFFLEDLTPQWLAMPRSRKFFLPRFSQTIVLTIIGTCKYRTVCWIELLSVLLQYFFQMCINIKMQGKLENKK